MVASAFTWGSAYGLHSSFRQLGEGFGHRTGLVLDELPGAARFGGLTSVEGWRGLRNRFPLRSRVMAEALITDQEIAILCDV